MFGEEGGWVEVKCLEEKAVDSIDLFVHRKCEVLYILYTTAFQH